MNVFDQTEGKNQQGVVLTHEQIDAIMTDARGGMKLTDSILKHAGADYGITNISELFPEAKLVTERPEWIKRDTGWVGDVLAGVSNTPFTKIKSMSADITGEQARAFGYIAGDVKDKQFFAVAGRTTGRKTIYKTQKFDRDDLLDVEWDVLPWVEEEMSSQIDEELARAYLFGDNRALNDKHKIDETSIRPIATDDDFYTAKVQIPTNLSKKDLMSRILRSRKLIKGGSGKPTLYTTDDLLIDLLLLEDKLGRRYYESEASVAAALGVKNIVTCDVLENGAYTDDDGNVLLGVLVNLADYKVTGGKGSEKARFTDFDIDYNQSIILMETRRGAALYKHRSAISLWLLAGTSVLPTAATKSGNNIVIPNVTGVRYTIQGPGLDEDVVPAGNYALTVSGEYLVRSYANEGYYFPDNIITFWNFTHSA